MITVRKGEDRGRTRTGWLDSRHSFSFNTYYDPAHVRFSTLRVLNEDLVRPGAGFPTHAHRNMEIISYVLEGALQHKDSLGNGSVIGAGDVQRMSAGTGIQHSEFNASPTEPVHFLQIWVFPREEGLKPSYEQKNFAPAPGHSRLTLAASPDGREGSVTIHQDTLLYLARLQPGRPVRHELEPGRKAWVQLTRGRGEVNGHPLRAGDGAALQEESEVSLASSGDAELLLFDLP